MTAYLARKNRSVRVRRISERIFEFFISHVEVIFTVVTVAVYATLVLLTVLAIADLACAPPR